MLDHSAFRRQGGPVDGERTRVMIANLLAFAFLLHTTTQGSPQPR
jgi:hypothetical protein